MIACEGRAAAVWSVIVGEISRVQGKYLPDTLSGITQEIRESIRFLPHISDAVFRRKRKEREQDPAFAFPEHYNIPQ